MNDRVMPDLNAWLDFFKDRKTSKYRLKILDAFQHDAVFITGMIYTQLLGTMPIDALPEIKESLQGLNFVEFSIDDYAYAGEISAFMLQKETSSIPSLIPLHSRYCELHNIEYLSEAYEKNRKVIDNTVVDIAKNRGNFKMFRFDDVNERVYLGNGYLDIERAEMLDLPENTLFQNSCTSMDYIHVRSRKYLPEILPGEKYTLCGYEGVVTVVNKEYVKTFMNNKNKNVRSKCNDGNV